MCWEVGGQVGVTGVVNVSSEVFFCEAGFVGYEVVSGVGTDCTLFHFGHSDRGPTFGCDRVLIHFESQLKWDMLYAGGCLRVIWFLENRGGRIGTWSPLSPRLSRDRTGPCLYFWLSRCGVMV